MPVAEDVGLDADGVADAALGRVAAVVDRRRGVLDDDSGGGRLGSFRPAAPGGRRLGSRRGTRHEPQHTHVLRSQALEWRSTSHHLASRTAGSGPRRTGSSTGCRRPGSRGGRRCRSARPTATRSPYKSRSAFAAWPGLLARPPRAGERLGARSSSASATPRWIGDWERFSGRGAVADQVRFEREWGALRSYARERGVRLIGDVADLRRRRQRRPRPAPRAVPGRGCSPARRPTRSQRAGSCGATRVYDWPALRRRRYRWWTERLRRTLELFDLARIDHFRGFVAYWAVPAGSRTARHGSWKRGPGRPVFDAIARGLDVTRPLPLIAEDLGVITPAVARAAGRARAARDAGAAVRVRSGTSRDSPHRFENHVENRVIYTGTHDHDTARGWYESLDPIDARGGRRRARRARDPAWARAVVGADPPGVRLAGAGGDGPGPGRARARERGADEPPGARERQLALADAARGADSGARARGSEYATEEAGRLRS